MNLRARLASGGAGLLVACSSASEGSTASLSGGSLGSIGSADTSAAAETAAGSGDASGSGDTAEGSSSADDGSSDGGAATTGGEAFSMFDSLRDGGTMGNALGGSFGADGWTITATADRIWWPLPRLIEGSVEFTMANVTLENLPLNDHEVFAMYEGAFGINHPIDYNPEFRVNNFKSMIRIYGTAEADRIGQQKLMWGMCPAGAPGYVDGACPCASSFFEEPFGGDGGWDGTPQRLRVEWGGGTTRLLRNDVEVLTIDWSAAGTTFGPEQLFASLGTPRAEDVATAGMPIGAVFYDVTIEGITGPAATCN